MTRVLIIAASLLLGCGGGGGKPAPGAPDQGADQSSATDISSTTDQGNSPAKDLPPGPDQTPPDQGVPFTMSFKVKAVLTYTSNKPSSAPTSVDLVLLLKGQGQLVTGYLGTWRSSSRTVDASTCQASGTLKGGQLVLQPCDIPAGIMFNNCSEVLKLKKARISATLKAGKISGTLTGWVTTKEGDTGGDNPITATLTGGPDTEAPTLALHGGGKMSASIFRHPLVSFTEPVRTKSAGGPLLTVSAGAKVLATTKHAPGKDPAGSAVRGVITPKGHWPFGATLTITAGSGVVDLAGNLVVKGAKATFKTEASPGLLTDGGFETLGLKQFTSLYSAKLVDKYFGIKPPAGKKMAMIQSYSAYGDGYLATRIKLPNAAKEIRLYLNLLYISGQYWSGPLGVTVSTPSSISTTLLSKALPKADKPLASGSGAPRQSGFKDVSINVTAMAGQEVVLAIGNITPMPQWCYPFDPHMGLLIDDIRVK